MSMYEVEVREICYATYWVEAESKDRAIQHLKETDTAPIHTFNKFDAVVSIDQLSENGDE